MGFIDWVSGDPKPSGSWQGIGKGFSHDWCRYRRYSHCFFTDLLDDDATRLAGYRVYVPVDRGYCFRVKWEDQHACSVSQPGANVQGGYNDATVPWEAGGQRIPPTPEERSFIPSFGGGVTGGPLPLNPDGSQPATDSGEMARSAELAAHLLALRTSGRITMSEFREYAARIAPPPVKPAALGDPSQLSDLDHLKALADSGLLTPAEVEALTASMPPHQEASADGAAQTTPDT